VLLIDNDKQSNSTKFFGLHDYERPSIADVLTVKGFQIADAIRPTQFDRLHVLPANMNLLRANKEILLDYARPQQTRLRDALTQVRDAYDFVIVDNAPDYNMSDLNALVASDHVIIPIKIDKFTFDGVQMILEQVEEVRAFNPGITVAGGLVTMYQNTDFHRQGVDWLNNQPGLPMFETTIRRSMAIDRMTFTGMPIIKQSRQSNPAKDYKALVREYLRRFMPESGTK
jgi:chromosome partitioning protein